MTTIKASTKKGLSMLDRANYNEGEFLADVYSNYSHAKYQAWLYCKDLYYHENGYNFRIISHNAQHFSVAWDIIDSKTGEFLGVRIETAKNSYFIKYN